MWRSVGDLEVWRGVSVWTRGGEVWVCVCAAEEGGGGERRAGEGEGDEGEEEVR